MSVNIHRFCRVRVGPSPCTSVAPPGRRWNDYGRPLGSTVVGQLLEYAGSVHLACEVDVRCCAHEVHLHSEIRSRRRA